MRTTFIGTIAIVGLLLAASDVQAQRVNLPFRGYVSVNGGYQASTTEFVDTLRFTEHAEEGSLDSSYNVETGPQFDLAAGIRIWRSVSAGVGVTRFTKTGRASITARIPHPFFFDRDRVIEGEIADLAREELAVHVQAMAVLPIAERLTATVFGGPSFFTVKQGLVEDVTYADEYPYDTATFVNADTAQESRSKIGFNAGVDVGYFFTSNVGVGGVIRFSRAAVDFDLADGRTLTVDAGGLQTSVGLRLRF